MSHPPAAGDLPSPDPSPTDNPTPAWLYSRGIVDNEQEFVERFLPLVEKWADTEIKKVHQLGRLDPRDFAQDVILKVFNVFRTQGFASTAGPGAFRGYLRTCVRNAVVDALRKAGAHYQGTGLPPGGWDAIKDSIDSLADRFDTAWERNLSLLQEAVRRVRKRVGPLRWEALRRVVEDGCKPRDVAAELGLRPSQVHYAKHDILRYLREELLSLGYKEG